MSNRIIAYKHLGKGIKKPRFRVSTQPIRNWIIYAVLRAENKPLSIFAGEIGIHPRSVAAWIYDGVTPKVDNQLLVEKSLGIPRHVLFDYPNLPVLPEMESLQVAPKLNRYFAKLIKNRILVGLLLHYRIGLSCFSREVLRLSEPTVRSWLYEGVYPDKVFRERVCSFFRLPEYLLFFECE